VSSSQPIDLGRVEAAIAVKLKGIPLLLVFASKALVVMKPKYSIMKTVFIPGGEILRDREVARYTLMSRDEFVEEMKKWGKGRIIGFIGYEKIMCVSVKKTLFGGLKIIVETTSGDKLKFLVICGKGTGVSREHVLDILRDVLRRHGVRTTGLE